MFDHCDYSRSFVEEEEEEFLSDGLDEFNQNSLKCTKYGDELLIDMVRARPYLYDKSVPNYKDTIMKENAWTEIATTLNITLTECQNRWTRLRQRFSKERQLRQQETRSGAEKPTRQKWVLFDNLAFLGRHIHQRKSFSNVTYIKPSGLSSVSGTSLKVQHSMVLDQSNHENEMSTNDNSNHKTQTSDQKSLQHTSMSKKIYNILPEMPVYENQPVSDTELNNNSRSPSLLVRRTPLVGIEETSLSSTSSFSRCQTPVSEMERSNKSNSSSSCFSGNQQRTFKKQKINPLETAFHQMNNTLSTMATQVCSQKKSVNDNDPDVLIGNLVTAELKIATEPQKSELKRKFMELLYCPKSM